jgi:hypothetical protein
VPAASRSCPSHIAAYTLLSSVEPTVTMPLFGTRRDSTDDNSVFPAYSNYINGVYTQSQEQDPTHLDSPLDSQVSRSIPHTNSRTTPSTLYMRHSYVPADLVETHSGRRPILFRQTFPPILDLRSPSLYPSMIELIAAESIHSNSSPHSVPHLTVCSHMMSDGPMATINVRTQAPPREFQ